MLPQTVNLKRKNCTKACAYRCSATKTKEAITIGSQLSLPCGECWPPAYCVVGSQKQQISMHLFFKCSQMEIHRVDTTGFNEFNEIFSKKLLIFWGTRGWLPPPKRWIKLNSDVRMKEEDASNYILQLWLGRKMGQGRVPFNDPTIAEVTAETSKGTEVPRFSTGMLHRFLYTGEMFCADVDLFEPLTAFCAKCRCLVAFLRREFVVSVTLPIQLKGAPTAYTLAGLTE
ncbi:hypothetical protein PanWU01x14_363520 [Parasponia andersonii]|uniref:Uncharacterized protein n=1 Tax=Parasponia andersonii TaxID=3476 RepID=A0A2P5A6J7_PARAD|nr:hypothetical protein PanWU01x14_363520 [Parasponia andersonii]